MGRMFRIITEGGKITASRSGSDSEGGVATLAVETVPFIEVGGPEGIVTSLPKAENRPAIHPVHPVPRVVPAPAPEPAPEPAAASPRVLSVSFHQFPKNGLRLLPTEVTEDLIAFHQPDHPVALEYRVVRDEIVQQFEDDGPHSLLFTSAGPVSGTTTVLLNVAASLTQDLGMRVLVVDADFARSSLARRLGVPETPGLAEVLGQTIPLAWALQPTSIDNLHVLTAGHLTAAAEQSLANDLPRLVTQVRQWFDWVIVDGGVWAEGTNRTAIGTACEAVVLVSRQTDIDRSEFTGLRATIAASGATLKGYVTTRM